MKKFKLSELCRAFFEKCKVNSYRYKKIDEKYSKKAAIAACRSRFDSG